MFEYYTTPAAAPERNFTDLQLGSQFRHHGTDDLDLRASQIALVGLDAIAADAVRERLFRFAPVRPFSTDFTDLGNVRASEPALVIPLLRELLDGQVQPLVIGGTQPFFVELFKTVQQTSGAVTPALVCAELPLGWEGQPRPLNEIWLHDDLRHFALLGYQQHRTPTDLLTLARERRFDLLRMSDLTAEPARAEPLIRQAQLFHFHLDAVRAVDAPASTLPSPAGLDHLTACQLFRYAGMSDSLRLLGIEGFDAERDADGRTADAIAQYLWYYLEGCADRKGDYPKSTENMTEYVVAHPQGYELRFWKSEQSGRWWLQPTDSEELIPCFEDDYALASRGELPDRWLQFQ